MPTAQLVIRRLAKKATSARPSDQKLNPKNTIASIVTGISPIESRTTLMIVKGKYDWYSPEKALGEEARSTFNQLSNLRHLPHIPSFVMELQQLIQDEKTDPKDLALAIRREKRSSTCWRMMRSSSVSG